MKTIKSYVEKLYPDIIFYSSSHEEISDRNPLSIVDDGKVLGFRFYDKEYNNGTNKTSNFSNWFFFGERLNFDDVLWEYGTNPEYSGLISYMKSIGLDVCKAHDNIFIPLDESCITVDEYIKGQRLTKKL